MTILGNFRIDELSAVDRPANALARVAILKREDASADDGRGPFAAAVLAIQKRDGCDRTNALMRAAHEHPTELEAYRKAKPAEAAPAGEDERRTARMAFMAHARGIATRDRIPLADAMPKARREHPDAFSAAYS